MTITAPPGTTPGVAPEPRSRLRARIVLAALSACGLAALAWASFVRPAAHVVYNPSDSVPVGWYRIESADSLPRPLSVGSIVLARLPGDVAALAAQRGYLPAHIPLLKRVGALAPQHVCIVGGVVQIDGVPAAAVLPTDRMGRLLLNTTNPASFDSRYFGPIAASAVIGVAQPIYLEKRP
mgnify:CR=1 FL=1